MSLVGAGPLRFIENGKEDNPCTFHPEQEKGKRQWRRKGGKKVNQLPTTMLTGRKQVSQIYPFIPPHYTPEWRSAYVWEKEDNARKTPREWRVPSASPQVRAVNHLRLRSLPLPLHHHSSPPPPLPHSPHFLSVYLVWPIHTSFGSMSLSCVSTVCALCRRVWCMCAAKGSLLASFWVLGSRLACQSGDFKSPIPSHLGTGSRSPPWCYHLISIS